MLRLLADGRLHSGEDLAASLGVSRAAVWKGVERLRRRGIAIAALPRRGYALGAAVELLATDAVLGVVEPVRAPLLRTLDLRFELDSTNSALLTAPPPPLGRADVVLCEVQHAGRGRRGRSWFAPFGDSLALSLSWAFADAARASPALSLCVGVSVVRALERAGARGIGLKWPNDVYFQDCKVGGVLIELRAEAGGPAHVVIGIGLNVLCAAETRLKLHAAGVRPAAVADACPTAPSRNFIAGAIIDELLSMLLLFEACGFAALRAAWNALDVLSARPVQVLAGDAVIAGIARGVDAEGALQLERDGRLVRFASGEVSLRLGGNGT